MAFLPAGGILGSVIVVVGEFQSGQDVVEFAALDAFFRQKSESHRQLQDRNAQSKTPIRNHPSAHRHQTLARSTAASESSQCLVLISPHILTQEGRTMPTHPAARPPRQSSPRGI